MNMNLSRIIPRSLVLSLLLSGSLTLAAPVTGTVTNKTTNKPSAGDTVVLVDVSAGMSEAATATTDARGHYSLQAPGAGPYLVRVSHQGASYFIAAPQSGGSGDLTVYDVAAKIDGVSVDTDEMLVESGGGTLRVQERYHVRNKSLPPKAQYSSNTFEIAIPPDAFLDGASATRPGGMGTNTKLIPLGQKGHYTFNIPIQPDQGEKETLFEVQYHISHSGKYTFTPQLQMPVDTFAVYVAKGINFSAGQGASFQPQQQDPRVQTYVARGVHPGQGLTFTISGEGQMPRDAQQGGAMGQQASAGAGDLGTEANGLGGRPGGGIGNPIDTPDPLSKYKWWILGLLAILLASSAAFILRKKGALATAGAAQEPAVLYEPGYQTAPSRQVVSTIGPAASYSGGNTTLMNILKEEMFAIESEKLSGTISPEEYAEVKAGLEALLKRALKRK